MQTVWRLILIIASVRASYTMDQLFTSWFENKGERLRGASEGYIVDGDDASNHLHEVILIDFDSNYTTQAQLRNALVSAFNNIETMVVDLDYLIKDVIVALDDTWLVISAIATFFLILGYSILQAGSVEGKSVKSVLMINLTSSVFGGLVWYAIGFGFFHGEGNYIGTEMKYYFTNSIEDFSLFIHSAVYAIFSVIIVAGSTLGRIRFESFLVYSLLYIAYVYPIAAHIVWEGYLFKRGFVDFAGGIVSHGLSGMASLTGAWLVGPRVGRFYPQKTGQKYKTVRPIKSNSAILVYLGSGLVFINWFYYNGGQSLGLITGYGHYAASKAIMNSFVSSLSSVAFVVLYEICFKSVRDLERASNALLAGLVGVGAGAALVSTTDSLIIGLCSGMLYQYFSYWCLHIMYIDEPLDGFSIHGVCGIFGVLCVGLFSETDGLFHGHGPQFFLVQLKGVLIVSAWGVLNTMFLFFCVSKTIGLSVSKEEQAIGLDLINHETAIEELDATQVQEFALRKDMENRLLQQNKKKREDYERKRESGQTSVFMKTKRMVSSSVRTKN